MIEQLTYSLNQMIRHERLARQDSSQQDYHHAEAGRYRAEAYKLERQLKTTRQSISVWVNLN